MVLNQNPVMKDRQVRPREQLTLGIKTRSGVNNVINLPLTTRPRNVEEGRILTVASPHQAIRLSCVSIRIHHAHFIAMQTEEHCAIAPTLVLALCRSWRGPFDMQLAVPEVL